MRTITEWRQWLGNEVGDAVPESSREITIATLAGMATAYGNHYGWKLKNVDLHDVETTVGGSLVNPATFRSSRNYSLAGKIDKVCTMDGELCIVDHKTTSFDIGDPDSQFWRQLSVDTQASMYYMLMLQNEQRPTRIVWDVVRKPRIRPKLLSKKFLAEMDSPPEDGIESLEMFADRVYSSISDDPFKYFQQRSIVINPHELAEFMEDVWDIGQEIGTAARTNRHPKNPSACMLYNTPCNYLGVCSGHDDFGSGKWRQSDVTNPELGGSEDGNVITNSRMRCFLSCRRKHDYRYNKRWTRVEEPHREALFFGTLWHNVMDLIWTELTEVNANANSKESCPAIGVGQSAEADCDGDRE